MTAPLSARLLAWQQEGTWMNWRGQRVFYKMAGTGPALLLVHGYPVGSYDWHAIWQSLQRHFTLIAPDMLGHGFSSKPIDGDYSLRAHAQMHDALLAHLGITRCQVIAFDLGVSVAQEMLAQRLDTPALPKMESFDLAQWRCLPRGLSTSTDPEIDAHAIRPVAGSPCAKSDVRKNHHADVPRPERCAF
ncbi:MAG: alpha/beta hydrolase [Brachymonas sp.]|nr:alpha/beta hydrolase [Brachymonas sp.]